MNSLKKPLMVYDGDCGFCRRWIERWRKATGDRVDTAPYQEVAGRFPEISIKEFETAVIFIEPDGNIFRAAEAVFRSLAVNPRHRWMLCAYTAIPGVKPVSEALYRVVANHRSFFSRISWGRHKK